MDFSSYRNADELVECEAELRAVDDTLRITGILGSEEAYSVQCTFLTKGNSKTIKALQEKGWYLIRGCMRGNIRFTTMERGV